jgi:hypothetical protein
MNVDRLLGGLLRLEDVREIAGLRLAFAAEWAARRPLLVALAGGLAVATAFWFYRRRQPPLRPGLRWLLATLRGATLALMIVLLAEPVLQVSLLHAPRPTLWLMFDGTDSMGIQDRLAQGTRAALAEATGLPAEVASAPASPAPSRQDYVAAWLRRERDNPLERLARDFRLRAFLLEAPDGVRPLEIGDQDGRPDADALAEQLGTTGRVTALGRGFEDLAQRHSAAAVQGLVVVGDFDQNAGPPAAEAAAKLRMPVYTVGVGPEAAIDVAVDIQAPPIMKKAEQSLVTVTLRQTDLEQALVNVFVEARPLDAGASAAIPVGTRSVRLAGPSTTVEFPFTPGAVGRHEFSVEVEPLPGEIVADNNRAVREVNVRDDFLRLMYVEYEPTWEWRFVKEVFHRDELVGMRGFRTFLRSADPAVRTTNELFLPTPAPPRREFFASDVIFLGDMPAAAISGRFCELTREFVEVFGGGLVVIAGSRFGPGELAGTPLADMLPVVVDPGGKPRDRQAFPLQLAAEAAVVDFMQLGADETENRQAWQNLGPLPWYQPVVRPHPQATVLAHHPTDTCADGRTPQPLVAIRRFGRGEVIYLGWNETWRLRRRYGEKYYRQFWGQMIHRLGLSHALGSEKRFVVRTDATRYESNDTALVTVEAYDTDFQPLSADKLAGRTLVGRLFRPDRDRDPEAVALPELRSGVYEARIPLAAAGEYRIRVEDPVTRQESEVVFAVTSLSAERRAAARNTALQKSIATVTGGVACDLATADEVLAAIRPAARPERSMKVFPLSMTWLCLGLGVALMIAEWAIRKGASLT